MLFFWEREIFMTEYGKKRYRVFVSYSSNDRDLVDRIREHIAGLGLDTFFDGNFRAGLEFQAQIELFIGHARLFIPVITETSLHKGWVQQETGFAYGEHIPILPIGIEEIPVGMIGRLHAITLKKDLSDLGNLVTRANIDYFLEASEKKYPPTYECARNHTERGRLIARYSDIVRSLGTDRYGCVRQKGALTSFHIPQTPIRNVDWRNRYDPAVTMPNEDHLSSLLNERRSLEIHAQRSGCRLIIEPFVREYRTHDFKSFEYRLRKLIDFLENMPDAKVVAVVKPKEKCTRSQSLTIVGDYFSAESVKVDASGYRHTIFTRNAATIDAQIEDFEDELIAELKDQGIKEEESKTIAISKLKEIINKGDASQPI